MGWLSIRHWIIVLVVVMHSTLRLTERVGLQSWANDFTAFGQTFPHAGFLLISGCSGAAAWMRLNHTMMPHPMHLHAFRVVAPGGRDTAADAA